MPWKCVLHETRPNNPQIGDMWSVPMLIQNEQVASWATSVQYRRDWMGKRAPLAVRLPCGIDCVIDGPYQGDADKNGWTVTGDAPNITLSPSVHFVGQYHGFITNGVITDDVDGRTF